MPAQLRKPAAPPRPLHTPSPRRLFSGGFDGPFDATDAADVDMMTDRVRGLLMCELFMQNRR